MQLLAHTTELKSATKTLQTVTQKELMVVPNAPRFLREGDTITLSAKITNLTNNQLSGIAKLLLTDAISGKRNRYGISEIQDSTKSFIVDKDGNTNVSWQISIPETVQAVQYKIVAKFGCFFRWRAKCIAHFNKQNVGYRNTSYLGSLRIKLKHLPSIS